MPLVMGVVMVEVAVQGKRPTENEENPHQAGSLEGKLKLRRPRMFVYGCVYSWLPSHS